MSRWSHRGKRKQVTTGDTEARVQHIMGMMRVLQWRNSASYAPLAAEWECSDSTIQNYAAEAWRRVCAEVADPMVVRPTVCVCLDMAIRGALEDRDWNAVARLGDTWTAIVGAQAQRSVRVDLTAKGMSDDSSLAERLEGAARALRSNKDLPS